MNIEIISNEEARLRKNLEARDDFEAKRMRRYLGMPDLSRQEGSPLRELVERILKIIF